MQISTISVGYILEKIDYVFSKASVFHLIVWLKNWSIFYQLLHSY